MKVAMEVEAAAELKGEKCEIPRKQVQDGVQVTVLGRSIPYPECKKRVELEPRFYLDGGQCCVP